MRTLVVPCSVFTTATDPNQHQPQCSIPAPALDIFTGTPYTNMISFLREEKGDRIFSFTLCEKEHPGNLRSQKHPETQESSLSRSPRWRYSSLQGPRQCEGSSGARSNSETMQRRICQRFSRPRRDLRRERLAIKQATVYTISNMFEGHFGLTHIFSSVSSLFCFPSICLGFSLSFLVAGLIELWRRVCWS